MGKMPASSGGVPGAASPDKDQGYTCKTITQRFRTAVYAGTDADANTHTDIDTHTSTDDL